MGTNTAFSASPSSLKVPGLINGAPPTPPALQALTTDLRETLALLVEGQHGVAYDRIASWIRGRITLEPVGEITFGPPRREAWRAGWRIEGADFTVFAFWVVFRLMAEGHVERLGRCPVDNHFFIRIR